MPQKNSNPVAVERRTDLASLFCMIGRHGPAVVLAVAAVASVLAAFVIYRTVRGRGKRRKATAAAAAADADGDSGRPAEDRAASVSRPEREPNPEDTFGSTDSTDVSGEGSSDAKEEASLIQSHPTVRLRRTAADGKRPPPFTSTHSGCQVVKEAAHEDKNDAEITDKDVSEKQNRPEAETRCALNSPVHFDQTSCLSENIDETSRETGPTPERQLCPEDERKDREGEAVAQISGFADFKDCECSESEGKDDDNNTWLNIPRFDSTSSKEEVQPGRVVALAEDPQPQLLEDQPNGSMLTNRHFNSVLCAATASVTCDAKPDENVTTSDACLKQPSICQDQQNDSTGTNKAFNQTQVDPAADACDKAIVRVSHPHSSTCRDQRSDVSEVTSGVDLALTGVINPPISKINSLSFEQSEQTENDEDDASSPGAGVESGISSMAVSPDLQLDMALDAVIFPVTYYHAPPETRAETHNSLTHDGGSSAANEKAAELESRKVDWAKYESAAANEDVFGHEIDDSYHSTLDQYMAQMAASVTSFTSEPEKKTGIKDVAEVGEESGVNVQRKKKMQAEKENEDECEKTEISIMEATMDHNEWITDGNCQVLPWMNVCVSPFAQTSHLPAEADKRGSSVGDAAHQDAAAGTSPPADVKPKHALSPAEESLESSSKKVVAVQPMPQNVNVTFRIHYATHSLYQTVAVTGNQRELGNWKEFIPLERAKDGHWATVVSLPAESHVEWKFVLLDKGEVCRWEECGNRLLDTGFGDDVTVHKWWGLL